MLEGSSSDPDSSPFALYATALVAFASASFFVRAFVIS
jgi:hypothetical protein